MKNTRKCPKCESRDIMEVSGKEGQSHYTYNAIAIRSFYGAFVTRYVCGTAVTLKNG
jgi:hypothetical protein